MQLHQKPSISGPGIDGVTQDTELQGFSWRVSWGCLEEVDFSPVKSTGDGDPGDTGKLPKKTFKTTRLFYGWKFR